MRKIFEFRTPGRIMAVTFAALLSYQADMGALTPDKQMTMSYMRDIYNFGDIDWYGSARTMGMGNAVTATGGDIGTVAINPAGSAVAGYSQISITPGVSVSTTSSAGVEANDGNVYFGSRINTGRTRFILPNVGFLINFENGNDILKGITAGFVANMSKNFNDCMSARGESSCGSLAGNLAWQASLNGIGAEGSLTNLAWQADMIGINTDLRNDAYFGINEYMKAGDPSKRIYLDGSIAQRFSNRCTGNKEDYIFNIGFNLRDMIWLGASLGLVSLSYSTSQNLFEEANLQQGVESDQFHNQFKELSWGYNYACSGFGVYGKFGIIAAPVAGLRIGAAFQTPTGINMSESYSNSVSNTCYKELVTFDKEYSNRDIRYKISTPMRANLGIAYTFRQYGVVSLDYEYVNYSQSRYKAVYASDEVWFEPVNDQIQGIGKYGSDCLGSSHLIRAGIEAKPIPSVSLRAGYNLTTDGTRFSDSSANTDIHAVSFGFGWSSAGSFFFDAAARCTLRPDIYYMPYGDYYDRVPDPNATPDHPYLTGQENLIGGPIIQTTRQLWTVVATVGWRF